MSDEPFDLVAAMARLDHYRWMVEHHRAAEDGLEKMAVEHRRARESYEDMAGGLLARIRTAEEAAAQGKQLTTPYPHSLRTDHIPDERGDINTMAVVVAAWLVVLLLLVQWVVY